MRKKSNIKRLLCALMASAMVLGLAACGGDGKETSRTPRPPSLRSPRSPTRRPPPPQTPPP